MSTSHKVSRISHRSHHIRSQGHVNDAYLHWYKSHRNSMHSTFVGFQTEESDNEFIVEDERYYRRCIWCKSNPYASCYLNTKKVRVFRHYIQDILEDAFGNLRWIDLPGGQHQVAIERNYVMNYIWLVAYMTNELEPINNKNVQRQLRFRLEELIVHAEGLGIIIQKFFKPLQDLVQSHAFVEEIGDTMFAEKVPRPQVEKKIIRLSIKPDETVLSGNKVNNFEKLSIYVRKDCQQWSRFSTLSDVDKMEIVSKGMIEVTENLKELKVTLLRPLKALKNASHSCLQYFTCAPPTLTPYVIKMKQSVKKIMLRNDFQLEEDDKKILEALLSETVGHYLYVLRFGEMLVEETWDIVLMARLCYSFIKHTQPSITTASYEAVLTSRFRKSKRKAFLKESKFTTEDFYKVECPDTLRKLPVVVSALNTEISLHLQGHRNTNSKVSTPMHRFTLKRKTDVRNEDEEETEEKPGGDQLVFVSADAD